MIGQVSANHGPGDARQAPDRAEEPLDLCPLLKREQVPQHRQHDRPHRAGTQPLNASHRDQLPHAHRRPGQNRTQAEQDQSENQYTLATKHVGKLAVNWRADGGGQQKGRNDPGIDFNPFNWAMIEVMAGETTSCSIAVTIMATKRAAVTIRRPARAV